MPAAKTPRAPANRKYKLAAPPAPDPAPVAVEPPTGTLEEHGYAYFIPVGTLIEACPRCGAHVCGVRDRNQVRHLVNYPGHRDAAGNVRPAMTMRGHKHDC